MTFYWLTVGILAVWRITHLLQAEDGPWEMVVRLRRRAGIGFWGRLLDCFYCLSIWVAFPFAVVLAGQWRDVILLWPALSGSAILLERATGSRAEAATALYYEEAPKGEDNGVLRAGQAVVQFHADDAIERIHLDRRDPDI
jgi:hypothetical protein